MLYITALLWVAKGARDPQSQGSSLGKEGGEMENSLVALAEAQPGC